MARNTLIYVFEPLDGWCFGFGTVMNALQSKYASRLQFDVVSGGMITGNRIGPLSNVASFIRQVYPVVEQHSGVKFGETFVTKTLVEGKVTFSSLEPSKALTIFKQFQKDRAVEFSHEIQKLIYVEGIDPIQIAAYLPLFERYGVKASEVLPLFSLKDIEQDVVHEFGQVHRWKIQTFPSVIMQTADGKAFLLASGYIPLAEMEKRVAPYLS